ncbi:endonuclease [Mycoplasma sp. Pen4]|uniref:endonuclease n=1 Tax=Mycoplasma sp. Pen4 TaxID=640330 RepID=UPI001654143A|nr:endonuclease [Mycoplasma sp. Pen4]QNM93684.1 endonuclease [Mycoplasma sp. Pen4]
MKLRKLLLTLTTPLVSLTSFGAIACAQPTDDNKGTKQPNTPTDGKPNEIEAINPKTDKKPAQPQPTTNPESPKAPKGTVMSFEEANNVIVPVTIPADQFDNVIAFLKAENAYVFFSYRDHSISVGGKDNSITIGTLIQDGKDKNLQLADATKKTFVNRKNKEYPNSKIASTFDETQNKVRISYYVASKNAESNTFTYSDKTFTSEFVLQKGEEIPPTKEVQPRTVITPVDQPAETNTTTLTPITISNYIYDSSNNYYAAANGLKGEALLNKLLEIQSRYLSGIRSYDGLKSFYNSYNAFRDNFYEKDRTILDIYSENPNGKDPYTYRNYGGSGSKNEGSGMNREHLIPQSWFGKSSPMVSDAHHVFPTDIKVNGRRGNYPHGDVKGLASWTSRNGSKLGTGTGRQIVFEPVDAFKGDIARAYLYFTTTYSNRSLHNMGTSIFTRSFPYIKQPFLDTYLKWNNEDKVSEWDIKRNNETAKYQGGLRNPFIDYPNLAESIFGSNPKPFVNKGVLKGIRQV